MLPELGDQVGIQLLYVIYNNNFHNIYHLKPIYLKPIIFHILQFQIDRYEADTATHKAVHLYIFI